MTKSIYFAIACGLALVGAGVAGTRSGGPPVAAALQPAAREFVVRDVRVFDGDRAPEDNVHVRDGAIVSVGDSVLAGVEAITGEGRTLLPGFIDAHTHAYGDALERALVFGVTTELDMFTDHRFAATMRGQQRAARRSGAPTSSGGHASSPRPKATAPNTACRFLRSPPPPTRRPSSMRGSPRAPTTSRLSTTMAQLYGMQIVTIDRSLLAATIAAAKARNKLAVVHIGSLKGADEAIAVGGASGLCTASRMRLPTPCSCRGLWRHAPSSRRRYR